MPARTAAQTAHRAPAMPAPYDAHPSLSMVQNVIANMKQKTGRTLEEWIRFVNKEGPADEKARREWLKKNHGLGTNYAWWIAERSVGKGEAHVSIESYLKEATQYVEDQYAGGKAGLRPILDRLIALGRSLGADVRVCPCKTMVPLYRNHAIAEIKASTKSRVDFGLALKGVRGRLPKRLIDTGGEAKKDRITHKLEITSVDDIDDEVARWLQTAYELDAAKQ